ncbi:MAG: hypothetical protein HFJ48_03665 [Clostridia bacterium]|nr:hypothetical protein [Clostridia bacterium]
MERKSAQKEQKYRKVKEIPLISVILFILIITVAIAILVNVMSNKKEKREMTPEIARSLEYNRVNDGDENTQSEYVKFDAFFLKDLDGDGNADAIRGTCNSIGKEDTLYMELKILSDGYFKDGTITINGDNFYFNTRLVKDGIIANNYIGTNTRTIKLEQIQNGTQKLITGIVRSGDYSSSYSKASAIGSNINNYSKVNSITITGTHVADDNTETRINKTINFDVDWYGTATARIATTSIRTEVNEIESLTNGEDLNLSFTIKSSETTNQLLLKKSQLVGKIPELNGYKPKSVTITGNNITYTYDEETQQFTAQREATVNENGLITNTAYTSSTSYEKNNLYTINVVYPAEAYNSEYMSTIELLVPVTTYYEAYNNPNEQFDNPYISNTASTTIVATWRKKAPDSPDYGIAVGRHVDTPSGYRYIISKEKPLRIYNAISEIETEDYYTVRWYAYTGTNVESTGLTLKEDKNGDTRTSDIFIKRDATTQSMEELTTNVGIYFSSPQALLGTEGWIKIYNDETNELITTFTSNNWNDYSSSNPYYYEQSIKHIRVETSATNKEAGVYVYNVKKLDDTYIVDNYTIEEFDNLQYIKSKLTVYLGDTLLGTTTHNANYEAPYSRATIGVSKNNLSTQETCENQIITISTSNSYYNEQKWVNGSFVVKLPEQIIGVDVNNIKISDPTVTILGYDVYEENGNYYIRILTENDTEATYNITINCNITPDPRTPTANPQIELYSSNEQASRYYTPKEDIYDVNGNANKTEKVNYNALTLSLISPNSLLTNQIATNYEEQGKVTIAPRIAKIDKDQRNATVEVNLTNNYSSEISDVLIQGVIPFEGNKFVIGGRDLESAYTTTMSNTGITIPQELSEYVTVYYSTNPNPNKNINDETNGWTLAKNVQNWDEIKTYVIDLGEYRLKRGESKTFTYEINIPRGIEYNEVSYSQHAIYFSLHTDAGKYATSTAVSKLGFMIAKQYDLEIVKYQENTSKKLPGITFTVTEEGAETKNIKVTNEEGKFAIAGLYVEKTYTIKEIRTTSDYVLNPEEITFYTYTDDSGTLHIKYKNKDGSETETKPNTIKEVNVTKQEGEDTKVQISIENQVKAKLKIVKKNGEELLRNVKFKLNGRGKTNVTVTTNAEGEINISGIYLNETYTLEETRAVGYYLIEGQITFKITSTASGFQLEVTAPDGYMPGKTITTQDEIPTINLEIQDNKIPTYSLELKKYAKEEETLLVGAQFKIFGEGISENGETYTTDENGVLRIDGLYEYVEEDGTAKGGITGEYTIKEIYAPEGYALDSTPIKFKGKRNAEGNLEIEVLEGETQIRTVTTTNTETGETTSHLDKEVREANTTNPIFAFSVENPPIFEVTKIDGKTKQILPNTKFQVYSLDENRNATIAKDINGEYIGTLEGEAPIEISFTSAGTYIWQKNDDGVWYSGNKGKQSSTATMTSNEFTVIEPRTIKFEWTVSSESTSYDYVYYTIKNIQTNATIGGDTTATRIGGTDRGTVYESLKWDTKTIDLTPGTYTISFTYKKDGSQDKGLDTAYVRNVDLGMSGKYVVTSNELGKISLNLPEGLYKIVEIEAPEGYELPEKEEDRTYYFGIGSSKPEETEFKLEWNNGVSGTKWNEINSTYATDDEGIIAVGSMYEQADLNNDGTIDLTSEGEKDAVVVKYNKSGEIEWAKNIGGTKDDEFIKVVQTSDGGYAVVGHITSSDINVDPLIKTNGLQDAILMKLDSTGNYQWSKVIGGTIDDYAYSLIEDSNQNIIVTGGYYSTTLNVAEGITATNLGQMDGYVVSFTSNGTYNWHQNIGGTSDVQVVGVTETANGYAVVANYNGTVNVNTDKTASVASKGAQDGILIAYDETGNYSWHKQIGGSANEQLTGIITTSDGQILAYGNYASSIDLNADGTNELTTKGTYDNMIIKYTIDGEYLSHLAYGGTQDDGITQVVETEDGGLLIGGYTYSTEIDINGDGTNDLAGAGTSSSSGYVIKLNQDNELQYADNIKGSAYDQVATVQETDDGGYIVGGSTSSTNVTVTGKAGTMASKGYSDGFVIKYNNVVIASEIPAIQSLTIENFIKEFKITTENKTVDETGNLIGGTITGEYGIFDGTQYPASGHIQYVEKVEYNQNSINEIVITPEENYAVTSVKINNTNYQFVPDENGVVRIPVFEEMLENKHITVEFSNTISSIAVNHYLWTKENGTTTTPIEGAENEYYTGQIGTAYTTSPNTDIDYCIITNADYYGASNVPTGLEADDYYIPTNATGNYTDEQQVITYYYKEKTYTLTVHHYLEGTEEQVPSINGGTVQDQVTEDHKKDEQYTTERAEDIDYAKYELVEIPAEAEGTITEDTTVIYYYKLKQFKITTDVANEGGSILGQKQQPYETVTYGENSIKDIIATPEEGYGVEEITINGEKIEFTANADKTVTLSKFVNMTEDKEVIVKFARLSGTVITHHYIQGTTTKVTLKDGTEAQDVMQTGLVGDIFATKPLEESETYYEYVSSSETTSGKYKEETQEVIYYYKLKEYNYKVAYYYDGIEDTTVAETAKSAYKTQITQYTDKVKDGYKLEKTENLPLEITENEENNVIKIYYVKRNDLQYTVNYLEKDTDKVLNAQKVATNQTFESVVKATDEVIEIDGYRYDSVDKESITIVTDETQNVINIYYIKRSEYSYIVNYLEKDTNKVLSVQKVAEDQEFEAIIKAVDEIIPIDGYNYDSCDKNQITITTTVANNVINLYYTKRQDLSYTVNYLEKNTDKVLSTQKVAENQEFEKIVKASDEAITIDGYNYDSCDKEQITITTTVANNVINLYYTKRQDLSYTVNYLEKNTDKVLSAQKVATNQIFEAIIKASDEAIAIDGYNYDSCDKEQITITTTVANNVINLYYTKRQDLSYTVNYLEKNTDKVLSTQKTVENQEFEKVIKAVDEVITINGYYYDSCDKDQITITTTIANNTINLYYTKRADLSYTVNYLDEDTNEKVHEPKVVENQEFEKVIEASKEVINIEGYEYSSCDKESIVLSLEGENVINIYYIKRSDLKYTVNYLEKGTNKELHESKVAEGQVYGGTILARTEVINIDGYYYDSTDKDSITLVMDETQNVLNIYYTIRTDVKYKVEYYYDGIKDEEETEEYEATFNEIIDEYEDKVREGYMLIEEKGIPLTIVLNEKKNIIEIYYAKETRATVQYINKGTGEILEERTEDGYVGKEFETEAKDFEGYILVEEPEEKVVTMEEKEIVLKYYYIYVSSGVIEKHIDIDTGEILDNETYEGNEGDDYKTEPKEFKHYDLVKEKYPENAEGKMKKEAITVNYYYKKKDPFVITVKYVDKETNEEIEEEVTIKGYEDEDYKTEKKEIEGYEFVEIKGEAEGKITESKEIIYYYKKLPEPDVPGEGGDDPIIDEPKPENPDDTTIIGTEIPKTGMMKQVIAISAVVVMIIVASVLIVIAIKGAKLNKKFKK